MKKPAVLLFRVSRDRQAEEGYGLDAQRADFNYFLAHHDYYVVKEFIEVESGDKNNRPEFHKAINYCKRHKAYLLVAKLDRLSRRVFITSMMIESKVNWRVVEYPNIDPKDNPFFFQMLAIVAEMELRNIRARTKAGLAIAKSKGVVLGRNGKVLAEQNKQAANAFAQIMLPEWLQAQAEGKTYRETAEDWNIRGISTARGNGCRWDATTVFRLAKRMQHLTTDNPSS